MALASVEDVARILQIEPTPGERAQIEASLEAAEDWARDYLRDPYLGTVGTVTESHYDIREDGDLPCPSTPSEVKVFASAGDAGSALGASDYTFDGKRVRLRPSLESDPFGQTDLGVDSDGPVARRMPGAWVRVSVTYTAPAVSPLVRDGVAHAAAAAWIRGPRLAKGMSGESIGDYSYTIAALTDNDPFFEQARTLLRGRRGRRRGSLVP